MSQDAAFSCTIDPDEIAKFEAIAAEWWDPDGKFKPLHAMNPCRLDYMLSQIRAEFGRGRSLEGLSIVDVGSGGGLIAEPMARLGASVTGLDAAAGNIAVAQNHAEAMGLSIDYRAATAEAVAAAGEQFDVVIALEIVEHVSDVAAFLSALKGLAKPGGLLFMSTLNRTAQSYLTAIVGAEHVLRWLPVGTHDWTKFLTPEELETALGEAGLGVVDGQGMTLDPLRGEWRLNADDLKINYILTAKA